MVFKYVFDDGREYDLSSLLIGRARHYDKPYPMPENRRTWYAEYLEEQKPPVKEFETELGFTRISWFEDGRFKVKRVPIVHG